MDVKLILPSQSDFWAPLYAGRSFYSDLLESGVKVYEREEAMLHAKTIVIDDVAKVIASGTYDAILIDLYEGPNPATQDKDDPFYGRTALARTNKSLTPGGVFAVWSEDADDAFANHLRAGERVDNETALGLAPFDNKYEPVDEALDRLHVDDRHDRGNLDDDIIVGPAGDLQQCLHLA